MNKDFPTYATLGCIAAACTAIVILLPIIVFDLNAIAHYCIMKEVKT